MTYDDDFLALFGTPVADRWNVPLWKVGLEWPPPERLYVDVPDPDEVPPRTDPGAELGFATMEHTDFPFTIREAEPGDPAENVMARESFSQISDEQREGMTHVSRGSAYRYLVPR